MTPEQELTAMIEAEMSVAAMRWMRDKRMDQCTPFMFAIASDMDAAAEMPDRMTALLRKLYWLATDPDDMVH